MQRRRQEAVAGHVRARTKQAGMLARVGSMFRIRGGRLMSGGWEKRAEYFRKQTSEKKTSAVQGQSVIREPAHRFLSRPP